MGSLFKNAATRQFSAALAMLGEAIEKCPDEHWDSPIARYPFWMVAYHTLCFADVYLSKDDASWAPQTGPGGMHPAGRAELDEEYPSRKFERAELLSYLDFIRRKLAESMAAETEASLAGPSGFPRLKFSRAELHLYYLRHIQHHTGQLTAILRRHGVDTGWVKSGN
ncbi:MAG: DinB family protein [Phycisphaerales bacterium]|nr:DinB family protein [Phycisphaerales bacterium]